MGLPDHANAKPVLFLSLRAATKTQVSSLRAFFEQQNATGASTSRVQNDTPETNGSTPKTRVRSNFIAVGDTLNFTPLARVGNSTRTDTGVGATSRAAPF